MRFRIVQGDELLSSHSGLALASARRFSLKAGAILYRSSIWKRLDAVVLPEHSFPEISHGEVATAMIGLICLGKPDFDAIEAFRDDPFSLQSLGLNSVPSSPTLRQRLDSARGAFNDIILEESAGGRCPHSKAGFTAPGAQRDAGPGLSGMSIGETCTALEAILWKKLPLAQGMAAGVP